MLSDTQDWLTLFLAAGAVLSLIVGWVKVIRPRWHRGRSQFVAARDAIVGRDAVVDTITGVERSPALPGVGVRLANQEHHLGVLAEAVASIASSHHKLEDHESRILALEEATVERIRADSAAAWGAMEAATKSTPDVTVNP